MPVEALIGSVIGALTPFLQQRLSPIFDASEELQKLSNSFTTIKAVLNDAERKQIRSEALQLWLQKLKDVAYEVDDMLDEWNTKNLREEIKKSNSMNRVSNHSVRCLCVVCCFRVGQCIDGAVLAAQTWLFNLKMGILMGGRLKKIRQNLDMICQERIAFGLTGNNNRYIENDMIDRETSSLLDESYPIFGRDDEKEEIISKLIHESSREEEDVRQKKLPVLAIIGMGGLGKTTLAQATYNDERVKNHFDIKIWVSIYKDFDVKKITLRILNFATNVIASDCESDLDLLQRRLQEALNGRRFLLVFDDVRNQDLMKWEQLRAPLISGERRGSRVIITTRSHRVAKAMSSSFDLYLKELLDDHSWLLFKSRAFDGREVEEHPDLEAIGRNMVKKLKGVPLYAKVVGGVMRSKRRKEEWEEFLNNEIWEEEEVADGIFRPLLLSYYDLPSQLKQCFTFCSVFSKGHVIEKEKIIQLWMAHGFLKFDRRRDLKETGERYLNDLVGRSLLQNFDNDKRRDEESQRFMLHDLLHDLAQYVGKNECSIFEMKSLNPTSLTKCRHSTLIFRDEDSPMSLTLPKANNLRTLLLHQDYKIRRHCQIVLFDKLIFLRALDMSRSGIKKLDGSIGKLRHLRYLNLEGLDIEELPEELTDLYNLQTLNLSNCKSLSIVPQEISNLRSLRYFSVTWCKLTHLPEGIGRLSYLRHLIFYNDKHDMGIKMRELKELNNLRSFVMDGLEKVRDEEDAREAQLKEKKQLRDLELIWKDWSREELIRMGDDDVERMEKVLDALHPPPNLISLVIWNFPGCRFPTWISMLISCTSVSLYFCKKCTELPSLGVLPSLKYLHICYFEEVTHVSSTFYGIGIFPKLQYLLFWDMEKLEEIELRMEDGQMPCLQELRLCYCPLLKRLPQRLPPTLQTLEIQRCPYVSARCKKVGGEDWTKIKHIPNIKIDGAMIE